MARPTIFRRELLMQPMDEFSATAGAALTIFGQIIGG
jgi:hypothetical protein